MILFFKKDNMDTIPLSCDREMYKEYILPANSVTIISREYINSYEGDCAYVKYWILDSIIVQYKEKDYLIHKNIDSNISNFDRQLVEMSSAKDEHFYSVYLYENLLIERDSIFRNIEIKIDFHPAAVSVGRHGIPNTSGAEFGHSHL